MKKIISMVLLLAPLSCFAYYGDPVELPGTITFFAIVSIICGILQIILFFKIWGMTNNVEKIEKNLSKEVHSVSEIRRLHFLGKDEEAYEALNAFLVDKIDEALATVRGYYSENKWKSVFEDRVKSICENNIEAYHAIGREIPSNITDITFEEYSTFGCKKKG